MSKPKLASADFERAAARLGVSVAHVRAVAEVESRGAAFLPSGEPTILFERHVFSKLTGGKFDKTHPNISNPTRGGYGASGQNQHVRLQQAVKLDREAALQSASWGIFQVMGFNWKLVGFPSLQDFINAMYAGEQGSLEAFVGFIEANKLQGALKRQDWHAFAKTYNGSGYASHGYHTKLAAAYKKWSFHDSPTRQPKA